MAEKGGQPGNNNATKGKPWRDAINRALKKRSVTGRAAALEEIAEKMLQAAELGEPWAIKELGDRIEGKPAQAIIGGDEDDPAIKVVGEINLVRPKD